MVEKNVIMAVLSGIAVTGVIPIIAGLVLLAVHKIKASSFWAGVLAYIIAFLAYTIVGGIISLTAMASSGNMQNIISGNAEVSPILVTVLDLIMALVFSLSMCICIGSCMKNTRTFIGAVSCGLGFGIGYMVTAAMSLYSLYSGFVMVNSGGFDKIYAQSVDAGIMTKEQVNAMKQTFTSMTAADALIQIVSAIGGAALFAAAAVFIMRGACAKKLFAGTAAAFAALAAQHVAEGLIPNVIAGAVVSLAIGAAALIFAVRMREKVTPPPKPVYNDSFMRSIESVKEEEKQ